MFVRVYKKCAKLSNTVLAKFYNVGVASTAYCKLLVHIRREAGEIR